MGTIANQKNGSNIQLEMQGIGESEASVMLMQPLLGTTTDTYTVEVTQLMMSLGEERALSGNEMIFAIVDRPLVAQAVNLDMRNYYDRINQGMYELDAWNESVDAAAGGYAGGYNPDPVVFENIVAYSATDFISRLEKQVGRAELGLIGGVAPELEIGVSPSGQIVLTGNHVFWANKMILVGTMMKAVTGWGDVIVNTTNGFLTARENDIVPFAAYNPAVQEVKRYYTKKLDSAWETVDRRKRIRVDLSIPVGLTLGWKDTHDVKTYSLQEFFIPRKSRCNFGSPIAIVKETQLVGTTNFVDGGGKLALKRLFSGPVQALRLALILIYEQYDPIQKTWVDKEKPVSMSSGDFFYLKLQFNKEAT